MNYFGHAAVASLKQATPAFTLGAMLPDLCAMSGVSTAPFSDTSTTRFSDPDVQAGIAFHIRTDAVFHQAPTFLKLNRRALSHLSSQGVRRGPARAAAHVGVEMLIDAHLVQNPELLQDYLQALRLGSQLSDSFLPLSLPARKVLQGLCLHLSDKGAQVHAATSQRFFERLGHTLRGRRRLEPTPHELRLISDYLATDATVGDCVKQLFEELAPLFGSHCG